MTNLILFIAIVSAFNAGLRYAAQPGYILEPVDEWSERNLPAWLDSMLIGCVTCMGSFWTLALGMSQAFTVGWVPWYLVPFAVPVVAYLGTFLFKTINNE